MKWFANRLIGKVLSFSVGVMALALIEGHAAGQCVEQKLLATDGAAGDQFGISHSIRGDVAVVGARENDDNGPDSGSVYIYRKNGTNWVQEAKLLPSDGAAGDWFGQSISISGDPGNEVIIIGAPGDNSGTNSGSAYIFRKSGENWVEEQKLLPSDGAAGDRFGVRVSISVHSGNEVAIVGAFADDDKGLSSGSAYIYRFNPGLPGWNEEQKLTASDSAAGDLFGLAVSISASPGNEVVIVGAYSDDNNFTNAGSAYIYRKLGTRWVEEAKLLAADGAVQDWFGLAVSISGLSGNEVAIVGAPFDDDNGQFSGSAYIYELPCSPACSSDLNDDGFVNVADLLLLLGAWGPNPGHAADFNSDGDVNVTDLLVLLAAWGPCP